MLRFQRMINALPLMVILTIAIGTAAHHVFPDSPNSTNASEADADSRTLAPISRDQQQSQTYMVVPGSVHDGDTLRVANGSGELKIRLCGIDAPEIEQSMGVEARDHLSGLIEKGDGTVIVVPVEKDRYGRTVAELFIKPSSGQGYQVGEEIGLNAQMVRDGFAHHYTRYSGSCPNGQVLSGLEQQAQEQGLGVWRDGNAVRPWEFRKSK